MASLFGLTVVEKVEVAPGITKEIVKRGAGDKPVQGKQVNAHYTGKLLNGTDFDSSRKRGKPFSFTIGIGQVIRGWDDGIASMQPGERAVLTCDAANAYGPSGSPPVIPGGATLAFDVELISVGEAEQGGCAIA